MQRQSFTYSYAAPPRYSTVQSTSSAFCASANPDEDWTKISDLAERRRIQNRIAQRNYRKKLKKRLEDLEKRAASRSASPEQTIKNELVERRSAPKPALTHQPSKKIARRTSKRSKPTSVADSTSQAPSPQQQQQQQQQQQPCSSTNFSFNQDKDHLFPVQYARQPSSSPSLSNISYSPSFEPLPHPYPQTSYSHSVPVSYTDFSCPSNYPASLSVTLPSIASSFHEDAKPVPFFGGNDVLGAYHPNYAMDYSTPQPYRGFDPHVNPPDVIFQFQ